MTERDLGTHALAQVLRAGAAKAQIQLDRRTATEFGLEASGLNLLRTTVQQTLTMKAIIEQKQGSVKLNQLHPEAITAGVEQLRAIALASKPDTAYDISEAQPPAQFTRGPQYPDKPLMYDRITEFGEYVRSQYPAIVFKRGGLEYIEDNSFFLNSNGVEFASTVGFYNLTIQFTAVQGSQSSSFNYSMVLMSDLKQPLVTIGSIETLLGQTVEQLTPRPCPQSFIGDVIITPDCLATFSQFIVQPYLTDIPLISGTSLYKNHLEQSIASPILTLRAEPVSPELSYNKFFSNDGYPTGNCAVIENGVLKTFLLSRYGAAKTGFARRSSEGGLYTIDSGEASLEEMITAVEQGILLCRFSGSGPTENGDFSGVAKNSYYLEHGKIQYPLSETMISGSIVDLLRNIAQVSRRRVNFGYGIYPWVRVRNIKVSGK